MINSLSVTWQLHYELQGELVVIIGRDTIRDTSIEFRIPRYALPSLVEAAEIYIERERELFDGVDTRRRGV